MSAQLMGTQLKNVDLKSLPATDEFLFLFPLFLFIETPSSLSYLTKHSGHEFHGVAKIRLGKFLLGAFRVSTNDRRTKKSLLTYLSSFFPLSLAH